MCTAHCSRELLASVCVRERLLSSPLLSLSLCVEHQTAASKQGGNEYTQTAVYGVTREKNKSNLRSFFLGFCCWVKSSRNACSMRWWHSVCVYVCVWMIILFLLLISIITIFLIITRLLSTLFRQNQKCQVLTIS